MERRGLCNLCANGKACALPARHPVWQCEEYTNYNHTNKGKKPRPSKVRK